ncbi:S8 family serine peptidase [Moheibacter lacus]|uniref:S8 family serine peptidase n=1 Tax=Moheibacter lacus TaxID=2745851 RepID=A0A838ZNE6_9FLAO|nr:S8 family serine peptidase [Moheibacter lacus]MBA5628747.1 S8 family serine peptidase [Moheibacter lacus]
MKSFITLFFLILAGLSFSQDLVLIKFSDKPSSQTYFDNPLLMLSQKALDRRDKYNIDLNLQDVPVEASYVTQVEALGIDPIAVSKWFNGVFAWCTANQISQAEGLSFVSEVETFVQDDSKMSDGIPLADKFNLPTEIPQESNGILDFVYGATETQVTQLNLEYLHNLGFTGDGITIAVMDNGFPGVESRSGFAYIRDNGQIKGVYNFIDDNEQVYGRGTHGTVVLSTIGGYLENEFVGTAIDADFYLFITENNTHELPDEEVNWIEAAERADSIGVDVINTSLGYSQFDDPRYDYTYEDMDGQTTFITRGAQIAAEKGIMVVNSAGNSGNDSWHYITAPADGVDVFTIGAVRENGQAASFSSFGPTYDGRIKPDVDALGSGAAVIRPDGEVEDASGTSFSSPIMAGAMACFIQAFPETITTEMRQKVRESGHLFENPTDQLGYGIPDFGEAYESMMSVTDVAEATVVIYPNPTSGIVNIDSDRAIQQVQLISMEGKIVRKYPSASQINIQELPKGVYVLKIQLENGKMEVQKLVKK